MTLFRDIQQAINRAIAASDYKPPLPDLEDEVWERVFDWRKHGPSNDCLEWLGDALMYAAISVELYRQLPKGTPDMFTRIRGPIVTNQTFALLTHKLNLSRSLVQRGPQSRFPTAKSFADLFETLPAEVYMRGGFDVLRDWVGKVFGPLITAAVAVYERNSVPFNRKRKRVEDQDGIASQTNKRQKTGHVFTDHSKDAKARVPNVSRQQDISSSVLRDIPAPALNTPKTKRPINPTPLTALLARAVVEKPRSAMSELSRGLRHSTRERTSRQSKYSHDVKLGHQTPSAARQAAWKHVLAQPSNSTPGLQHAVLASPSRYTDAAPSAPACGPGSSRFDPIIIDDEDELDDGGKATASAGAMPHEVIELLDDDSEPDLEIVEAILVKGSSATKSSGIKKPQGREHFLSVKA